MRYQFIQPSPMLAPYVRHYWMLEIDLSDEQVTERVVPTDSVQLMFHYKKPFVSISPDRQINRQPQSMVSGLSNSYIDAVAEGESGVIAVVFHPYGACNFFRFPLCELQNQNIHLGDVFSGKISLVEEQICECGDLKARVEVIEQFLTEQFLPVKEHDFSLIKRGTELIKQSGGQVQSRQLAEKLLVTPKNLERKFVSLVGQSPKQLSKIVRFWEVMNGLMQKQPRCLTEYAYHNGYFDQSHFIREFKNYSGYTPSEFVQLYPCPK